MAGSYQQVTRLNRLNQSSRVTPPDSGSTSSVCFSYGETQTPIAVSSLGQSWKVAFPSPVS